MGGATGGAAAILGGRHHRLELLEVDATGVIAVDGLDHVATFVEEALEVEAVEREVELRSGDEAVFVAVVEIEGVVELARSTVGRGVGATESGELREADEAVVVGVEVFHDAVKVLQRDVESERSEHAVELVGGDLTVAVGVEAVEDCLEFVHVFEVRKELTFENL
ncbi:hypothetical protein HKD37_12G033028 [Glycine soja]